MKNAEARDAMIALVQETYAEFPAFMDLPQMKTANKRVTIKQPLDNSSYVETLHTFCALGMKPTGRIGNDLVA